MSILLRLDSTSAIKQGSLTSDFRVEFANPIKLDGLYQVALAQATLWYSYNNISAAYGNNTFRYSLDAGATYTTVTIPDGIYNITDVDTYLHEKMFEEGDYTGTVTDPVFAVSFVPNYNTLRVKVVLVGANTRLDMTTSSLYRNFGLTSKVYTVSEEGTGAVDITNGIDTLNINTDLITAGSYSNGVSSNSVYTFTPQASPGSAIVIEPTSRLYLPVSRQIISSIRVWVSDNQGRSVDFNGNQVQVLFELKKL